MARQVSRYAVQVMDSSEGYTLAVNFKSLGKNIYVENFSLSILKSCVYLPLASHHIIIFIFVLQTEETYRIMKFISYTRGRSGTRNWRI